MARDSASELKSGDEYRIERFTWFRIVGILVISGALPTGLALPNGIAPLAAGSLLLGMACFSSLSLPQLDLSLPIIVITIFIIGAGVFTRET